MSKEQSYTVKADGWVAGQWRAGGSTVFLTVAQAKYENVTPDKDEGAKVEVPGSLDAPAVKAIGQADGQADKPTADEDKRSRTKK